MGTTSDPWYQVFKLPIENFFISQKEGGTPIPTRFNGVCENPTRNTREKMTIPHGTKHPPYFHLPKQQNISFSDLCLALI
jgi:hypothetical protein